MKIYSSTPPILTFLIGALLPGQVHTTPFGVTIEHPADFTLTQKPNCVISINPNGPAASNGLRINDTITAVNNSSVLQFTPENLATQLEYVTLAGSVTARIVRTGRVFLIGSFSFLHALFCDRS